LDADLAKTNRSQRLGLALLLLGLVSGSLVLCHLPPAVVVSSFSSFQTFVTVFLGIFIEATPLLLAGSLASGFINIYVDEETLHRFVPQQPVLATLMGAAMGFFFPVCECGVVPFTRSLYRKGVPLSMGIAFILAAPVINPIVILSTYTAFGWGPVFWGRIALSFFIAVSVGLVFSTARPQDVFSEAMQAGCQSCGPGSAEGSPTQRFWLAMSSAGDDFLDMGHYLVIGAMLTAFIQTVAPQSTLLGVGQGPLSSVLVLLWLAFLLSVCSTVDAFLALAFANTFTTGSILAFLVFGPMVDIKSSLMYLSIFKRRAVVYLILLTFTMTLAVTLYVNLNLGW